MMVYGDASIMVGRRGVGGMGIRRERARGQWRGNGEGRGGGKWETESE